MTPRTVSSIPFSPCTMSASTIEGPVHALRLAFKYEPKPTFAVEYGPSADCDASEIKTYMVRVYEMLSYMTGARTVRAVPCAKIRPLPCC